VRRVRARAPGRVQAGTRVAVIHAVVRVLLTCKLAEEIDGVDLSRNSVGEVVDLPPTEAQLLVAEGWATPERRHAGPLRVVAFRRDTDLGHSRDEEDEEKGPPDE